MGYRDVSGLVLQRRDVFENDQEVVLLTEDGGIRARAPHARKSQKTFCGRLEPPNDVSARLYRSREQSRWIVSDLSIETVYADLMGKDRLRYRLWPLLALFRDLFPEGEPPGACHSHLRTALSYLEDGFKPPLLVTDRVLIRVAQRTGVAFDTGVCSNCDRPVGSNEDGRIVVSPTAGTLCGQCQTTDGEGTGAAKNWTLRSETVELYRDLKTLTWEEVCARRYPPRSLRQLEEIMYRVFRYHFEISLDTLKIRKSL